MLTKSAYNDAAIAENLNPKPLLMTTASLTVINISLDPRQKNYCNECTTCGNILHFSATQKQMAELK